MRNICGCRYFCDLVVLCEVLLPFGNTFTVAVSPAIPLLQSSVASSLLRVFAGSNERDRSCGGDIDEEVVVELDDSPGCTNGTKFSVLQKF